MNVGKKPEKAMDHRSSTVLADVFFSALPKDTAYQNFELR